MTTHKIPAPSTDDNPVAGPAPSVLPATSTVAAPPPDASPIRLACVEVCNFRRLAKTRLELDETTTILVGANNSGKTSLLTVLRNFLSESPGFRAFDISLSQWAKLRELSQLWEALDEDPTTDSKDAEKWEEQYRELQACMPHIDLWFEAQEGAYNHVAPFITTLKWSGGAVGVRVRLEPVEDVNELRKLAWRYREARSPVRKLPKNGHAWPTDLLDYWLRHSADLRSIAAYRLAPVKGPLANKTRRDMQQLPLGSQRVELPLLRKLIRVDFVSAQRGLGAEEDEARSEAASIRPGMFSSQLLKLARQHLNVAASGHGNREDLVEAIAKAQAELDDSIYKALQPAMEDVEVLGYPGLHDPQQIHSHRHAPQSTATHCDATQCDIIMHCNINGAIACLSCPVHSNLPTDFAVISDTTLLDPFTGRCSCEHDELDRNQRREVGRQ